MRRLVTALLAPLLALVLIGALAPVGASAQDIRVDSGMGPDGPGTGRPPSHRPRPPFVHRPSPFIPCCVGWSYLPTDPPPPVIVAPPPPIVYVVPTGPSLAYVPTPRVEPAPEVQLATGRWERHGNGKEYPYTWVWVGAAGTR
jgi:hypothetical protein